MRVAIVGSRSITYLTAQDVYSFLKHYLGKRKIHTLISGGATGVDAAAEACAKYIFKPEAFETRFVKIEPSYNIHGKRAPLMRNTQIVNEADVVIAIWDGHSKGTLDAATKALKAGCELHFIKLPSIELITPDKRAEDKNVIS